MDTTQFDYLTIEPFEDGKFAVYGHGEYEASSVLAGQYRRAFVELYDTQEEAVAAFPDAQVEEGSTKFMADMAAASFDNMPEPDWFDPADAGEEW